MSEKREKWNGERPLRVMWIAHSCSLQDDEENPGLTGRMEPVMVKYCGDSMQLAVAYMADGIHESRFSQNGITYYGIKADLGIGISNEDWEKTRKELLDAIEDFHPDIIQCFGAEWPYGAIAEDVNIPVVIHMMGFLNIYYPAIHMARGEKSPDPLGENGLKTRRRRLLRRDPPQESSEYRPRMAELRVMRANRFFFGRTEWDRNVVRYYSPGSRYYYVPEMIKPAIYEAAGQWKWHCGNRIRLFSLSSADDRKGNEIILYTADILKNLLGMEIEWRVAGSRDYFPFFEERAGIRHEDVGIALPGMITGSRIIEELKAADLFIHPSIMDNSPHAVCEAQLVGCPVIASNVGGVPDLVKHRETGFLYPYNEPHTLAFLIANLCREKQLLTGISEQEVQTARQRHDPEMIAGLMLQAYKEIVEEY